MRALLIDAEAKAQIKKVIAYAQENRLSPGDLQINMGGLKGPIGDNPNHVCHFFDGYRVVYSIEQQPIGDCHHLSVSVDAKGRYPTPQAVELIMKEFGIPGTIMGCVNCWMEEEVQAINVLQLVGKEE
jgi:hypothetical protein